MPDSKPTLLDRVVDQSYCTPEAKHELLNFVQNYQISPNDPLLYLIDKLTPLSNFEGIINAAFANILKKHIEDLEERLKILDGGLYRDRIVGEEPPSAGISEELTEIKNLAARAKFYAKESVISNKSKFTLSLAPPWQLLTASIGGALIATFFVTLYYQQGLVAHLKSVNDPQLTRAKNIISLNGDYLLSGECLKLAQKQKLSLPLNGQRYTKNICLLRVN